MRYFSLVPALLLLVGLISACKPEKIDGQLIPDPGLTWQPHPDFIFDRKVQLTSYADSNIIILSGIGTTAIAPDPDSRSKTDTTFEHFGGQAKNNGRTDYRPLLHPNFFGFLFNDLVYIVSTREPVTSTPNGTADRVILSQLDPDFASFYTLPVWGGETMAANKQDQFIVPYTVYDRSSATPVVSQTEIRLMLVSLNVKKEPFGGVKVARTQKITLPGSGIIGSIQSIGPNFIVSTGSGTYRIKPDGSVAKTYSGGFRRQFTFSKTTYGLSGSTFWASTDQGESWSTFASNVPPDYSRASCKQVGNQLIAYLNSQLFQLNITPTMLTAIELDNTGLEDNQITSIAQFRNTAYISTMSGVFTKPVRTFLMPKLVK